MIVIVDRRQDLHVRVVKNHLERRGAKVFVADPVELGAGAELSFWSAAPGRSEWRRRDGAVMPMSEAAAIWFRPKGQPTTPFEVEDRNDRRFIQHEWRELMRGVLASLDVPMINPLFAMLKATKPYQLAMASRAGLAVPDTLITSSARRALEFVAQPGAVVHKTMTPPDDRLLATKVWEEHDTRSLPELELAPTMFQRRVEGTRELRVTVVGERLFAAEVSTTLVDGRLDLAALHVPHQLPGSVARGLLSLLERLSLPYAAVDMRIDARGEYQFLEANPAGQFLWIEIATGMPISAAMADLLYVASHGRGAGWWR
jgi:hypothetical protein